MNFKRDPQKTLYFFLLFLLCFVGAGSREAIGNEEKVLLVFDKNSQKVTEFDGV